MRLTYAIDPGKARTAVAAFDGAEFVGVYFTTASEVGVAAEHRGAVFMEIPRIYPGSPVRQNDLIDLTAAGMGVAAKLTNDRVAVKTVEPAQWKGQAPKEVIRKRIKRLLTQSERMRLDLCLKYVKKSLQHNLYDAIGIGLYSLKRARKGIA